ITHRSTIQTAIPQEIHYQLIYSPKTKNDEEWMNMVVEIERMLELGKRQEKLLRGETTTLKDKGKKNADNKKDNSKNEDKKSGPDVRELKEGETFRHPAFG